MPTTEQRLAALEKKIAALEKAIQQSSSTQWIPEEDAMKILSLGKKSLQLLRIKGELRYSTATGRKIKYYKPDIERYLDSNSNKKAPSRNLGRS